MSLNKYTRDMSLAQKRRAQTMIQSSIRGPEKYLGLHSLEQMTAPPHLTGFMGPTGTEMIVVPSHREQVPSRVEVNKLTKRRRDRVADAAQRLLDEIHGVSRQPSAAPAAAIDEPKKEAEPEKKEESPPPPPPPSQEPPSQQQEAQPSEEVDEKPADQTPPAETKSEEPQPEPSPAPAPATQTEVETSAVPAPEPQPEPVQAAEEKPAAAAPPSPSKSAVKKALEGMLDKFAVGKSSFGSKNWKRRFFVLPLEGALTYHEERGSKALGTVAISSTETRLITRPSSKTHGEVAEQGSNKLIVIVFKEGDTTRKLLLRCENEAVHQEWCEQLKLRVAAVDSPDDL